MLAPMPPTFPEEAFLTLGRIAGGFFPPPPQRRAAEWPAAAGPALRCGVARGSLSLQRAGSVPGATHEILSRFCI